jgi:hypothetical protein
MSIPQLMLVRCDGLREYSDHLARSNNGITPIDSNEAQKQMARSAQFVTIPSWLTNPRLPLISGVRRCARVFQARLKKPGIDL